MKKLFLLAAACFLITSCVNDDRDSNPKKTTEHEKQNTANRPEDDGDPKDVTPPKR